MTDITCSGKSEPIIDGDSLSLFAGRWNSSIHVKITSPAKINKGPIKVI